MLNPHNKDRYDDLVRKCAIASAMLMLWISALFSKEGFSFDQPDKKYIGWILAGVLIVVEIVWNKKGAKHGITLYIGGLACYCYGLYTNILGILVSSGVTFNSSGIGMLKEFLFAAITHPIALFGGILLELLPEPLLIWALTGSSIESDPVANFLDAAEGFKSKTQTATEKHEQIKRNIPTNYQPTRAVPTTLRPASTLPRPTFPRQTSYEPQEPTYHRIKDLNEYEE